MTTHVYETPSFALMPCHRREKGEERGDRVQAPPYEFLSRSKPRLANTRVGNSGSRARILLVGSYGEADDGVDDLGQR